jgi:hypothetical protein
MMKTGDFADISVCRILHFVQSAQVTALTSLLIFCSVLFYLPSSVMGHHKDTALRSEVLTEVNISLCSYVRSVCTTQKMSSKYTAGQNFLPAIAQAVT